MRTALEIQNTVLRSYFQYWSTTSSLRYPIPNHKRTWILKIVHTVSLLTSSFIRMGESLYLHKYCNSFLPRPELFLEGWKDRRETVNKLPYLLKKKKANCILGAIGNIKFKKELQSWSIFYIYNINSSRQTCKAIMRYLFFL